MCLPALAAIPALFGIGGGAAAGTALALPAALGIPGIATAALTIPTAGAGLLSGIGTVAGLASTGLSLFGQIQQGQAQQDAYKYNAQVQRMQALDAERRGSIAEGRARTRAALAVGAQHAEQGGSGLVAGADSGGDVLAQTAEFGAMDAAMARINGAREAWGYRAGAQATDYEAKMANSANNAKIGSTFLTGAANAFGGPAPWWESLKTGTGKITTPPYFPDDKWY